MPPRPSGKAGPRTSNKDYTVILLYRVCQGQRKGHFSVHGDTVPHFPSLSCHPLCCRAFHPQGERHIMQVPWASFRPKGFLVSSLSQQGSQSAPSFRDLPHSRTCCWSSDSIICQKRKLDKSGQMHQDQTLPVSGPSRCPSSRGLISLFLGQPDKAKGPS